VQYLRWHRQVQRLQPAEDLGANLLEERVLMVRQSARLAMVALMVAATQQQV
jgi:hypothetical protein